MTGRDFHLVRTERPDVVAVYPYAQQAAFPASILFGRLGCHTIIDHYVARHHYANVKRFVVPAQIIDRAAEFIVPEKLSRNEVWSALCPAVTDPS